MHLFSYIKKTLSLWLLSWESERKAYSHFIAAGFCHGLKQGVNKLSGRCSLLTPTLPPGEGKRRKRERDLQMEYKQFY